MYLKSIEIQGFKSFANKIVFEFHNGITGIVGPNGSGKSNVADAVRWVLGEQKVKQLRSSNMQDVIFSGTELRKPQGFAYVAITLDNSDHHLAIDYDQVTVSRRVYRSGESEYMINGSACRLKDIYELFYDTGIGKEGYSIIGQGQIDKILSGKPEERRELFDEAAGIVKFKRRKLIAQKKLEDEKQNLIRVNDILTELEKQVGPLARQSEAAKEYLRLKEDLKKYDVNQFLMETEGIQVQMKENQEKETIVAHDLEDAKQTSEGIREEYDVLDTYLAELEEAISKAGNEKNKTNMEMGSLEGRINVLKEQINTEQMNAEHIAGRMRAIHAEIQMKMAQAATYEEERSLIADQVKSAVNELKDAEEVLNSEDEKIHLFEQQIEEGKSGIIDILNEKASLTAKQQRYETMLEQVNVRRSEVCQKLLKFKSDESEQDERLEALQKEADEIETKISESQEAQAFSENRAEELEGEVKRLNKNLNDKQQEYHTSYTKLESLRNIAERYEGYGGSIRRIMEVRDRIHGIHGVVADLVKVPKKYEIAIETALGGSIQNIVTDSEETAKQLIEYLKKNRYGRATFLPLTSVSNRDSFRQDRALTEPGVLGLANTLVEAEDRYKGLLNYLLGRVVVVDTIEHAIALAKKFQYSFRIVTLEGELLSVGGSMTGGAFKNSSNLLGRKREMEELEEICSKALTDVERLEKELVLSEGLLGESREELEKIRAEKQQLYLKQNTVKINIRRIEDKKEEIKESYGDLERENGQLEVQIREISTSQQELLTAIDKLEMQNQETVGELERLNGRLETARADREQYSRDLSSVQLKTSSLKQKDDFELENIRRVKEESHRLEEELAGLSNGTHGSNSIIEEKQKEIDALKGRIAEEKVYSEELEGIINEKSTQKESSSREQKELFRKREELTGRISLLDKELFRLQSQKEKLDEWMESHINYMWNEYELTFSTAKDLKNQEWTSLPEIKRMIQSLKEEIRKLGNVNVNAIEDYKEVSERYEFMKTQHDDLVAAEGTLLKIIDELDTGMRKQFEEKFREIRQEFDKVFKELFGGGRGTLELVEDEDILEAGIQIISQPPGKKLQNMMQLSGGEKALTAIALLFAIQNLKPSPFCLLDEIEAALDDSNVDRFAKYLHKLTKYTQFIVITHRRGTMLSADRLYGITMQEKGVSTLVSVNLIEEDLES
ncbi:chromosome segregation protein SMC [Lacrimispora sphenoides]|uniref:Chromosome partition protein Smc n=1 Tax=Lacrimispora sphenoides JCM 1415 TaxID=1297793 RepID=A0ABY1C606_9FIRM|nr:chromosome segregation protein SMC [Lacrimispora sphenoides]SET72375.1 condensin subunit Smc [[Clostridium] sphenoides JCM 1415]SUY50769.1 chromosome segregation protein SMC [Lacrimispora sphenoides]